MPSVSVSLAIQTVYFLLLINGLNIWLLNSAPKLMNIIEIAKENTFFFTRTPSVDMDLL